MYSSITELKKDFHVRTATLQDAEIVADMFNRCSQEILGKNEFESGELTAGWESANIDMEKDTLTVFDGNTLIGYADVWGVLPPYVRANIWVRVDPLYKNRGIGWTLNKFIESRAEEITKQAEDGLQTFTVSYINVEDKDAFKLLTDLGAKPVRYSWVMEADLPEQLPAYKLSPNMKIRAVDPTEYREVYLLKEEAFSDHWGHIDTSEEEGLKEFHAEHVQDPNYDADLWFAVEIDGEMVGVIFGNKATPFGSDYGWVAILAVKRKWRNKGLGKTLLLHFFQKIKEKGSIKVGLSVDSNNLTGATRLYESVGLKVIEQYVRLEKTLREGKDIRIRSLT